MIDVIYNPYGAWSLIAPRVRHRVINHNRSRRHIQRPHYNP